MAWHQVRTTMWWGAPLVVVLVFASGAASRDAHAARAAKPLDTAEQRTLALQVALDRAGFSPGEIDARPGENTDKALRAFQAARGLETSVWLDEATAAALGDPLSSPIASYVIGADAMSGPFAKVPVDMMAQAQLPALDYESPLELIAERFHASPALIERLNPDVRYETGQELRVPNVEPLVPPDPKPARVPPTPGTPGADVTITVSAAARTLTVSGADGSVLLHAPVTVGSARDPLPNGTFKIVGVHLSPVFNYSPDLFWDAEPSHAKAKIAPGPNNPVGFVWMDLNREHLGIHGTPRPSTVGKTQSHGCIRLTNWDALRVAALVRDGTPVVLQ